MTEERILVVQLRQLGDILLTTPCLRVLRRHKPKARITFLSHGMGRLILDHCPYLDEHFSYETDWTWRQELRLAHTLREREFDFVFDFMNNPRSAFYTLYSGGRERVAFRSARRPAYTNVVPKPTAPAYIVREKFLLLEAAGMTPSGPQDEGLILPWFEGHTHPLMRIIGESTTWRDAPVRVVLSPTHRREPRKWPLARYAALADRLVREWGAAVIWPWGPGEEGEIDHVRSLCREPTIKAPKTSFRELAALIGNADLFVGNSNGPSHVAVATGIVSLQLHGHTRAASWCPLTLEHQAIQSPEFGHAPMPSMAAISEEAVWEKLMVMRPMIAARASAARAKYPRVSWRS